MNIMNGTNYDEFGMVEAEQRLTCLSCSYVYHSKLEEPYDWVPPRTPFEDLPDDWSCPEYGVHKVNFARTDPS